MGSIILKCEICGKSFSRWESSLSKHSYCSRKCYAISISKQKIERKCIVCSKIFFVLKSLLKHRSAKYCSKECNGKDKHLKNSSLIKCKNCGKEIRKPNNEIRCKNDYCSMKCYKEAVKTSEERFCKSCGKLFIASGQAIKTGKGKFCSKKCWGLFERGKNNPGWKGGKIPEYVKVRMSTLYKEWRFKVFEKNNFTCQKCGKYASMKLRAHHIYGFTKYPQFRLEKNNGITFCDKCHEKFHSLYGQKYFNSIDTIRFLEY